MGLFHSFSYSITVLNPFIRVMMMQLCFSSWLVCAQTTEQFNDAPPPPPMPATVTQPAMVTNSQNSTTTDRDIGENAAEDDDSEDTLTPQVTIAETDAGVIQEYRIHGKLRMIKVIPQWGLSYFLIDRDGDGILETTQTELDSASMLNQWILFSW